MTIPASVTTIGDQVFFYCTGLTSVIIKPYGELHTIGSSAFNGCNSLTSITLPDTVITIGASCFSLTHQDLTVTMNTKTIDSTTYTSPTTTDIAFFGNTSVTLVEPPDPTSATWEMNQTISTDYPYVLSMAQNKNTGQYRLAICTANEGVTNIAADVSCRIFISNDYGNVWNLLEKIFSTDYGGSGSDGRDIDYPLFNSGTLTYGMQTMYGCAISDDGKYQAVSQKSSSSGSGVSSFMWFSTDYGVIDTDSKILENMMEE